ncbi:MAG: hypothetical protein ABIR33_01010, partial [Pyrinomonadaceae bacterium]
YIYMLGWMAAGLLSSASALPALYFAIREKTNLLWWLIVFVNLSPGIWFFLILPHFAPDPNATQ